MIPVDRLLSKEDFSETAHKERVLFLSRNNLIPRTMWAAYTAETAAHMPVRSKNPSAHFYYGRWSVEYGISTLIYAHPWEFADFPYTHGMGSRRSKEEKQVAIWEAVAFLHWLHTTYRITDYEAAARMAIYKFMEPELFDLLWRGARTPRVAHTTLLAHMKLLTQRMNVA